MICNGANVQINGADRAWLTTDAVLDFFICRECQRRQNARQFLSLGFVELLIPAKEQGNQFTTGFSLFVLAVDYKRFDDAIGLNLQQIANGIYRMGVTGSNNSELRMSPEDGSSGSRPSAISIFAA